MVTKFSRRGFTLIELLVVLAIIALLLSLATPRYFQSIDLAKENILKENLRITRHIIDEFYGDSGRYPSSLEELVEKKYLRALPIDPISPSPWTLITSDSEGRIEVKGLKSSSVGQTLSGILYSDL